MELAWLIEFLRLIVSEGLQTVVTAWVMFLAFKRAYKKLFSEENVIKIRDINERIDEQENVKSQKKIKDLQQYLEDNFEDFQKEWFDRVNIWHNHNWTRKWAFHFQYYSLIAEVVAKWLELFSQHWISTQRLNYYMFAEYEQRAIWKKPHLAQTHELGNTARVIAEDLWTKSIYIHAIYNLQGRVDAIIFCSSVYKDIVKEPNIDEHITNLRIIFNK